MDILYIFGKHMLGYFVQNFFRFGIFSLCGLTLPLSEDFFPHETVQGRKVNSGKRKAYCVLWNGHHSAEYTKSLFRALGPS
jgi:hypothetical protein